MAVMVNAPVVAAADLPPQPVEVVAIPHQHVVVVVEEEEGCPMQVEAYWTQMSLLLMLPQRPGWVLVLCSSPL